MATTISAVSQMQTWRPIPRNKLEHAMEISIQLNAFGKPITDCILRKVWDCGAIAMAVASVRYSGCAATVVPARPGGTLKATFINARCTPSNLDSNHVVL